MSVEDSESRRFELNISLRVSQADLVSTSGQKCFFFLRFFCVWIIFCNDPCSQRAVRKSCGGYLWNSNLLWQHCVSISIGLIRGKHICCRFWKNILKGRYVWYITYFPRLWAFKPTISIVTNCKYVSCELNRLSGWYYCYLKAAW